MSGTSSEKAPKQEKEESASTPAPAPTPVPPTQIREGLAAKPTREGLANLIFLVLNLSLTSHSLQTNLKPLLGKTYGPMSFHLGALASFLVLTFALPNKVSVHRRTLEIASLLQAAAAVGAKSLGAIALPLFGEDPTVAAWVVHTVSSFPALGLGGAVWLHWAAKFMDEEPTRVGRLVVKVFSCVALISVIKYLEPIIGNTYLDFSGIPPRATLIFLAMTTLTLSVIFRPPKPPRDTPPTPSSSNAEVHSLGRSIAMFSIILAALAVQLPPRAPLSLQTRFQRFTSHGFVQVVDNLATAPATRYIRLDSSILGEVSLKDDSTVGDAKGISGALIEAAKIAQGSKSRRALVLGVQSGASAKALLSASYNTTIVDINAHLLETVQTYFDLPTPNAIVAQDPAIWFYRYARQVARAGKEEELDVVVHDVFDNGELPARDYTVEFWEAIRSILDENGILAVRYVGKPSAVTFKSTLNMLRKHFRTCRGFHSNPINRSPLLSPNDIAEIVIHCTPSDTLLFTPPTASAHISTSASAVLSSLDAREIDLSAVLGDISPDKYLLKEEDPAVLRLWGKDGITDYWKLMRRQYPQSVWYNYQ